MGGRNGGRKQGSKNVNTTLREAATQMIQEDLPPMVADPLELLESAMRYYYGLGIQAIANKVASEQVQKCFDKAVHAAAIAAPYRHARLSAVKHVDSGVEIVDGVRSDASLEELRYEIAKRVAILRDKGIVDLDALPPPVDANGHDSQAQQNGLGAATPTAEDADND